MINWRLSVTNKSQADRDEVALEYAQTTKTYQQEAAEVGMSWAQARNKINMVEECQKLVVVQTDFKDLADVMELFWRGMSGHAHSFGYAAQAGSIVERSTAIPGGQEMMVTTNETSFTAHAMGVAILLIRAIQLYSRRSELAVG